PIQTRPAESGGPIGLIAIGLAVILALIAGWRLSHRADRSAPLAARSIGPAPTVCAHCGRTLPHDAVFCAQCGRPVGATITITKCPRCDRALRPGAQHCARCGQAVP
ncbi:MAG TPA: zinc ribbon domain-containing protein, partial [Anaerolineae bacterium]|nr:zinc ribbon domain-containing protein [Anaerolineae bacterium]